VEFAFISFALLAQVIFGIGIFFPKISKLAWLASIVTYGAVFISLVLFKLPPQVELGNSVAFFQFSFIFDHLSLSFLRLISFIGFFINIFAHKYFKKPEESARASGFLTLFGVSMMGLVASNNLLLMFVFWEFTTLLSFLMIAFDREQEQARLSALRALLVTGAGGLCFLAAVCLISWQAETLDLAQLFLAPQGLLSSTYVGAIAFLILLSALSKSAQFPFHFWLPGAMSAPAPVSAFLHSATMVKAGIFLLIRFNPLLGELSWWHPTLLAFGLVTAIYAGLQAYRYQDLKQVLAYSTVSALGLIVAVIGIGTEFALRAAFIFILVHAFYKAGLFMSVGILEKIYGTRDLDKMSGLLKISPILGGSVLLLSLAMMGMPPFLGFVGKELIYESAFVAPHLGGIVITALIVINALNFGLAAKVVRVLFPKSKVEALYHPTFFLNSGVYAFSLVGLLLPYALSNISFWHGFSPALFASLMTFLLGFLFYYYQTKMNQAVGAISSKFPVAIDLFDKALNLIMSLSRNTTKIFFSRRHIDSVLVFVAVMALLAWFALYELWPNLSWKGEQENVSFMLIFVSLLIVIPLTFCLLLKDHLALVLAAGLSGLGVGLYYLLFSGPDLALTQILVDTFLLILFVFVTRRIRPGEYRFSLFEKRVRLFFSFCLALPAAYILSALRSSNEISRISTFFAQESYSMAFGKNVVNVILVDFRSFDTLGEITVLAVAAIGVLCLGKVKKVKS
jgi:multicomponent Na+:H+ antiporter subunit A